MPGRQVQYVKPLRASMRPRGNVWRGGALVVVVSLLAGCSDAAPGEQVLALATPPDAGVADDAGWVLVESGGCSHSEIACGDVCTDVSVDPHNCGTCGVNCPRGQVCHAAHCVVLPADLPRESDANRPDHLSRCARGTEDCGNGCIPVAADVNNCGQCGRHCDAGQACTRGRCQ